MKFIIDTNVLLQYPKIFEEDKELVITIRSLKEIDGLKKSDSSELRYQCRRASHTIFSNKNKIDFITIQKNKLSVDDEIIYFAKKYKYGVITNDLNIQIACYKMNIICLSYNNEEKYYTGVKTLSYHFDELKSNPEVDRIIANKQAPFELKEIEFLIIKDIDTDELFCIFRYTDGQLEILDKSIPINNKWSHKIKPINNEQQCLFSLLNNDKIKILLAQGKFGSGKTMCLTNYALQELERGNIGKIIWVSNNSYNDDSRELGTLPGDLFEKEFPLIGSLIDIIGEDDAIEMLRNKTLEIIPISVMRGRNLKDCIILVNEAQNLTEKHIKLLIARCAEGSRIFFDGDIKQIDNYIFKNKNGLRLLLKLANSKKFSKIFGVVTLDVIERSFTAQASDYLDSIT
jgi:phosphate starvation-inducible PhoH-like protein